MAERVLVAKLGLDGHDRGAKVVARALRDGGMEVVYTGLHRTPEQVVAAAVQEDVDVIGISSSSGGHMAVFEEVMTELPRHGLEDVVVIAGGSIPPGDAEQLRAWGVREVYGPGSQPDDAVELIKGLFAARSS